MDRTEILEAIEKSGGEWKPVNGVVLKDRKENGNDPTGVDAEVTVGDEVFKFWLMGHYNGHEFFVQGMNGLDCSAGVFAASKMLAKAIEYEMPEGTATVVEKVVEKVNKADYDEKIKLEGKVEAYENLLLGRTFTANA